METNFVEWIKGIRQHLHAHPELSFQEKNTATYIQEKLDEIGLTSKNGIAGTGVIATLPSKNQEAEGVALRADMDALPIQEETGLSYSSCNSGVMHACGHDGHVAMLLGAAALLSQKELPAPVRLIFQPAEEKGNGAQKMVEENVLENMGAIFAGHIDTHYRVGTLTVDEGIICAYTDPFCIKIKGRSGHAARPHEAIDAIVAASHLVMSAQTIISRGVDPNRSAVITIGCFKAGTAQNIIAEEAVLRGTMRTTHEKTREKTIEGLHKIVTSIAEMHGVSISLNFEDRIPAVKNHCEAAELARHAATITKGVVEVVSQGPSSLGGEDFAFYQQEIPGCLIRFGAGFEKCCGVAHSRTFNFDEDVLAIGAHWYANVACSWLESQYKKR